MSAKVAFCVVAWNNADVLGACLDSLLAQTDVEADIYLIDNGSTDDTRQLMRSYPGVRVTWAKVNHGFARGNNLLIAQALGDINVRYVALVNSDAVLDPGWASTLVDFAERRPNVGSLQGLTLDFFDHETVDSQHIYVNRYLQGVQYGYAEKRRPGRYYPRKVFGVNAAAALYSRAMIEALPDRGNGFFDERFFMYYEDVDVAFRALVTGWDAWFVPAAIAYHMGSASAKRLSSSFSVRMTARNLPAMVYKNAPWPVIRRSLLPAGRQLLVFLRAIAARQGLVVGLQTAAAAATGLARLPIYRSSRRRIQAARATDTDYLMRIFRNDGILG